MKQFIALMAVLMLASSCVPAQAKTKTKIHSVHAHSAHAAPSKIVDINTADEQQLQQLKGIGAKRAKAIVAYRKQHGDFKSLQDLALVSGVSKQSLTHLLEDNSKRLLAN